MFDLPPDVPPIQSPMLVAAAPDAKTITQTASAKGNRTIGVCHLAENPLDRVFMAQNSFNPAVSVWNYLERKEGLKLEESAYLNAKVVLLQGPTHGSFANEGTSYKYQPIASFFGADRATFQVEIGGWRVKAHYHFGVHKNVPGGTEGYDPYLDKEFCPNGRYWKISLNHSTIVTTSGKQVRHNKPLEPTRYLPQ